MKMDRRQRKTRDAILGAFTELLSEKDFGSITVGEIIERADVGRATFYAHFETKDFLMRELCRELFCHIFDSMEENSHRHHHIFDCNAPDSVFLHLFLHLQKNDNSILELLSSSNNDLFLRYFKEGLRELIEDRLDTASIAVPEKLPRDFFVNHVSSVFVETVRWWAEGGMAESPEKITEYFTLAITGDR